MAAVADAIAVSQGLPAVRCRLAGPQAIPRFDQRPRPSTAHFFQMRPQLVEAAVGKNSDILLLFQFLSKGEYFGVGFPRRVLQADRYFAHRHGSVVPALDSEQKKLPEQVARPPIVLENLDKIAAPAHIVGDNAPAALNLTVFPQTQCHEQNLCRHGRDLIHRCKGIVTGLAIRLQVAWGRNEYAIRIESVGH